MKFLTYIAVVVISLTMFTASSPLSAQESGVSDTRFARLARGINLPYWFWYAPDSTEGIKNRFSDNDFQLIHDLGFTFVRVPIDLGFVLDENRDDLLNPERLALLDEGFDRILAYDLGIVIDLHSTSIEDSNNSNYSGALEDEAFITLFERFWRSFASHLSIHDPEYVFFEPMNEPVFEADPDLWPPIQARLLAAIRESAPKHTLIATGAVWSSMDTLLTLEPLDDPNIIYNFHFYEPFLFTHQGALWTWYAVHPLRNVPYPSSPEAVESVVDSLSDEEIQGHVRWYGEERWDIARIDERIAQAATWGEQHGVRVICTEFGAYSLYAPADDRVQWIHDSRITFEKYNIGWAMWEYDEAFGLVEHLTDGVPTVDVPVAEALGLNS